MEEAAEIAAIAADEAAPAQAEAAAGNAARRARGWCFTLNNPTDDEEAYVLETCECGVHGEVKWYVFQREEGEAGTPHLQGAIRWDNAKTFANAKDAVSRRAHMEVMRQSKASQDYCSKSEGRIGRVFTNLQRITRKVILDPLYDVVKYAWQTELEVELFAPPDARKVIWYVDPVGSGGKTTWTKSMLVRYPRKVLVTGGKTADMLYIAQNASGAYNTVIINLTRDDMSAVAYSGVEQLKDGLYIASKYKSACVVMPPTHIVLFSNSEPDISKLSADRWDIRKLRRTGAGVHVQSRATVHFVHGAPEIHWN